MPCRYGHCPLGSRVSCGTHGTRVLHGAWELLSGGTCGAGACFRGRPTEVAKPKLPVESELNHRGDGRGAEQRPFRRKRVSGLPRAVPPPPPDPVAAARPLPWSLPGWSRSCGNCYCRTPSASAGYGTGGGVGDWTGTNGRRWWESPDSDPGTPPRPPSSSRPLFVTPPPCPPSATCSPRRSILR